MLQRLTFIIAITFVPTLALADSATDRGRQATASAQACSMDALKRYALSSNEPAKDVAEAAFTHCQSQWAEVTNAVAAALDRDSTELDRRAIQTGRAPPNWITANNEVHDSFIVRATPQVFELRANR